MRRVISLWLPTWPTDRLARRRPGALPVEAPVVTRARDGRRLVVAAANRAALALGLRPGMPLAGAQAMVPGLEVAEADPAGDAAALADLAAWCLRYSPLTAPDPPDGIWIDATGCAHLHGGEAALLDDLLRRLGRAGVAARAAIADTPGAAWAVARHAAAPATVVAPGAAADALAFLPVAALRLPPGTLAGLRRMGLDLVGQLVAMPRAPLARRFGAEVVRRLDGALGRAPEPITPVVPPEVPQHLLAFPEPLLTAEALGFAIGCLTDAVCAGLERAGLGARRVELILERVDDAVAAVRLGLARPTRDPRHLARLLAARLEEVDPGLGVSAARLVATLAEPLAPVQATAFGERPEADLAPLIDRLAIRFGAARVFRVLPFASVVPERSLRRTPPLEEAPAGWPEGLPRPVRLLTPPQPVEALSALPDHPPAAFTWRGRRHRVRRADGPERVAGEWWRRDGERRAVRDYWAVEDEEGRRFWLFRRGDGEEAATGDLAWFLHGLF
ncbi:DNA polymerase Y family protein [Roseomonas mucosa]|uniref:Y-family DNA polymerase n=1 Tax=Roseomonas mucosa TaxID=207340 RepID=UPI0028CFA753|nr:DNA polymerase Y family protein [Roseomonas mucosa]MDT8315425.1 DNA polymerase Y family protein [Roseomonas mucosa]MDT8361686.1 DNA polymerase Y family protein [Roseomonas mucosa]